MRKNEERTLLARFVHVLVRTSVNRVPELDGLAIRKAIARLGVCTGWVARVVMF